MRSPAFLIPVMLLASATAMADGTSDGQERAAALLSRSLQAPAGVEATVLVRSHASIDAQSLAAKLLSRPATERTAQVGVALNRPSKAWGAPRA